MSRVLVTRRLAGVALARLKEAHDVEVWPHPLPPSPEDMRELASGAEGLLTLLTDAVDEALLDACPDLRVVSNYAVGTDNVDLEACRARGIAVGRTPDVLTAATADLTMALMLAAARRLPQAQEDVMSGEWQTWEPYRWLGLELEGATLLIVGPGRIGRAVAHRAEAFGMDVVLAGRGDPLPIEKADVISLHCPLTPETRHLIDADAIARMKSAALLVNTARGALVDTDALIHASWHGMLGGAALDVTDPEPLPADHPLLDAPRVIVLPHIGSATMRARSRMTEIAVANLMSGLAGEPLPHPAA